MIRARTDAEVEHLDVLIVGAGLSGIGAACHLRRRRPGATFAILEAREAIGGTWDLFRFPGVRSDSDMQTLGYSFAPWTEERAIADGASILNYIRETAERHGVSERVRFGQRVVAADWSEAEQRWTAEVQRADGDRVTLTCSFLLTCCGYFDYAQGYAPRFAGQADFAGEIVHPQRWPSDLDYAGQRVVVIGSGATAITLVPAMAADAGHVTMLQRSPSYIVSVPRRDPLVALARRWLPDRWAYSLVRAKNVTVQSLFYRLCQRFPARARAFIRKGNASQLPAGFDVDTHFRPDYGPWDQRVCFSPGGDLFGALRAGSASIVTDRIARFTKTGIALESGGELAADVIVTATGLRLQPLGGMTLSLDSTPLAVSDLVAYRGTLLSGVPNFAFVVGYASASWTLKADLASDYVCRLLRYMDDHGFTSCRPPASPPGIGRRPLLDLTSGYIQRALADFPAQGTRRPWRIRSYPLDRYEFTRRPVADGVLRFTRAGVAASPAGSAAAVPA